MLDQLKIQNLTNIMTWVLTKHEITKAELVQLSGLSNTTVSDSINSLLKKNLVKASGMKNSIGGRRAKIFRLNPSYGFFLGIDLSEKYLKLCVTDCENKSLDFSTIILNKQEPVIEILIKEIDRIKNKYQNLLGIGIGIEGSIDIKEQVVINAPIYNWEEVHLKEIIERHFLVFTLVDHRTNGATLAEGFFGDVKGCPNYLCLFESSPTKLGVVLDSELCRGKENLFGKLESLEFFLNHINEFSNLFNSEMILIKYKKNDFFQKLENQKKSFPKNVQIKQEEESLLVKGMALLAQKSWFRSIYFIM